MKKNCSFMKQLFSILMVMVMMAFIAGCGSSEEKGVFVQDMGFMKMTYEVYHKKDTVTKIKMLTESDAKALGQEISDEELQKSMDESIDEIKKDMEGVEGIEVKATAKDGKGTMEINVDIAKVQKSSPEKAKEMFSDDTLDISSYEAAKASLEKQGFKEEGK